MIISPSHTLEYMLNDIIITSSIGDVLLHHPKYHCSLVPRLHLQRFGRWSLGTNRDTRVWHFCGYLSRRRHVMPSKLPPRDCVSRPCHGASPSERASARMRASLSRCVNARAMRGPDSREEGSIWESTWPKTQRAGTARVLPVAFLVLRSHARESENA